MNDQALREALEKIANERFGMMSYPECVRIAKAALAAPEPERAHTGDIFDELSQCLQIIVTNAGNITTGERQFPGEVKENVESIAQIYEAVDRAAKAIRHQVAEVERISDGDVK